MKDPWFPIAAMLIVVLTAWLGILGPLPADVSEGINKWQNLIAALIAVGAAWSAYRTATRQIKQNDLQEKNRRRRKHASVRAVLPLALSQTSEYAQKSTYALIKLIQFCKDETLPPNSQTTDLRQILPNETLQVFAEFIEYSDDIDTSLIETLVTQIQIHDSRVRGINRDKDDPNLMEFIKKNYIGELIIDAASIYAAAGAMFEYARRREKQPPTTVIWENVRSALRNMGIWEDKYQKIYKIIDRKEIITKGPFDRPNA